MGEAVDRLVRLSKVSVSGYTKADGTRVSSYVRGGAAALRNLESKFQITHKTNPDGSGHVRAQSPNDNAGELSWNADGQITWVASYLPGQGVATGLLEKAKSLRPDIHHSLSQSETAQKWAAKNPLRENPLISRHGKLSEGDWTGMKPRALEGVTEGDVLEVGVGDLAWSDYIGGFTGDPDFYRGKLKRDDGKWVLDAGDHQITLPKTLSWHRIKKAV